MLGLCSLSLLAGGNVRKLVCEPILDEPKYTVIHKVRSHDVHGVTLYSCRVEKLLRLWCRIVTSYTHYWRYRSCRLPQLFDTNDSVLGPDNGYFMGDWILNNKSVPLTVTGLLR